jgi:hypothetical protein
MLDAAKMRIILVAGVLVMALFFAVLTAVNAECPSLSSGVAATRSAADSGA